MTVEEIFSIISTHMAKGLRVHNQLANAFGFLNLRGYRKCHEYHYFEETYNYRRLNDFYLDNYNKIILENEAEEVNIVPSKWYKYFKEDVDANTKRAAIKDLTKIWVDWEKETKTLLEKQYKELYELGEICGMLEVASLIQDVSEELKIAHEAQIDLDSIGYDISLIVDEQSALYKKYKNKIKNIYEDDV